MFWQITGTVLSGMPILRPERSQGDLRGVFSNLRRLQIRAFSASSYASLALANRTFAFRSNARLGALDLNPQAARGQSSGPLEPGCIPLAYFAPCHGWPHPAFCSCDLEHSSKAGKTERHHRRRFRRWPRNRHTYKPYNFKFSVTEASTAIKPFAVNLRRQSVERLWTDRYKSASGREQIQLNLFFWSQSVSMGPLTTAKRPRTLCQCPNEENVQSR